MHAQQATKLTTCDVPLRIEIGPRDIKNDVCMIARRDTLEKSSYSLDGLTNTIKSLLETVQNDMLVKARIHREDNTYTINSFDDFRTK